MTADPYYRADLAWVHHVGFGRHAENCAPGILHRLGGVRLRHGLVLELGCGSGLLTKHLVEAGHRVIATDASPAMLDLARAYAPGCEDYLRLTLPDDPLPEVDAIVSIGHVLSYLDDDAAIERSLVAAARALRPGGVLAIDLCDLRYADIRAESEPFVRVTDDWAIFTRYEVPAPNAFERYMTTFVRDGNGAWRRDDEHHHNTMFDTARIPALLAEAGLDVVVDTSFGDEILPDGLMTITSRRAGA